MLAGEPKHRWDGHSVPIDQEPEGLSLALLVVERTHSVVFMTRAAGTPTQREDVGEVASATRAVLRNAGRRPLLGLAQGEVSGFAAFVGRDAGLKTGAPPTGR